MTQQKKKAVSKKVDPLELATFVQILSACSAIVPLTLSVPKIIDTLTKKDRIKDSRKWKSKLEELHDYYEGYKKLVKEMLLLFDELEAGFGEKEIKAENLLFLIDRNKFYRLLELKRDLAKLTADMVETINEFDKFVFENDLPEFNFEKEDDLLLQFDRIISLWGTGTFNNIARELKSLNRLIEKRIGYQDHQ
jgi:hypothetical protein